MRLTLLLLVLRPAPSTAGGATAWTLTCSDGSAHSGLDPHMLLESQLAFLRGGGGSCSIKWAGETGPRPLADEPLGPNSTGEFRHLSPDEPRPRWPSAAAVARRGLRGSSGWGSEWRLQWGCG